ncbi:MAG TPA: hypothetical protein ENN45_03330 [Bacteroidetes bacterium]|nr:hypothetical protein [Bacteroidota bacterium]
MLVIIQKYYWIVYALLLLIIVSCAVVGQPSGGEKDVNPPKVLSSVPENKSTNVQSKSISITFDEFIKLNSINQKAYFSPPLKHAVQYSLRSKSLIINFEDTLKQNTTYCISFADAIGDNNENNILQNYQYVFSTGADVDTMQIKGFVRDAFTLKPPQKSVIVMLYKDFNDSLPYTSRPDYMAKTDKQGYFVINYIADASYKIFALEDVNNSLTYDQPGELIGFLNQAVKAEQALMPQKRDSLTIAADTNLTEADSIYYIQNTELEEIFLFEEVDSTQRIVEFPRINDKTIRVVFKYPADKPYKMRFLDKEYPDFWVKEWNKTNDTLNLWLLQEDLPDSLLVEFLDEKDFLDTIKFQFNINKKASLGRGVSALESLSLQSPLKSSRKLDYYKDFVFVFSQPIDSIYENAISLYTSVDTLFPEYTLIDSTKRRLLIKYDWEEGESYQLIISDSSIYDIYGFTMPDSLNEKFRISEKEEYGTMKIKLQTEDKPYILQLLDAKDKVKAEKYIKKSGSYIFKNLPPASYGIRLIEDDNQNRRWDAGNYAKKRLAERVYIYSDKIDVKANWEHEVNWIF